MHANLCILEPLCPSCTFKTSPTSPSLPSLIFASSSIASRWTTQLTSSDYYYAKSFLMGYASDIIPIFAIVVAIYVSFSMAAMHGIAVAASGMLSTIATGLAIDAYGPISDNAGGIAEMAGKSHKIRQRTNALDAAGNTTAAIGKGFAIGSTALVSLALSHAPILVDCLVIKERALWDYKAQLEEDPTVHRHLSFPVRRLAGAESVQVD
ncbi:Pyrophosphate-energized vacuolar membrane proton pump [Vitis vinifera]|uniref:H(+)-exporting diphosphatase n=1 Tax=Vitis vinifera TaxID=29760 RepID=A0A438G812_VITVI|nr:Pyrophosphate-energized vacuolar membrane proton pump [Vitis vinifera]